MAHAPNLTPAVYIIPMRKNGTEILMARRYNTGYEDGKYSLVAGHVDDGEMPLAAMVREAKEEAGITLDPAHMQYVHTMYREGPQGMRLDIFFTATEWDGDIENMEPHKCDDMSWFPLNAIPENTIPYIRRAIEHMKATQAFSELVLAEAQ